MKKSMFFTGVSYVLVGFIFLFCGIAFDTNINSLLWGFACAAIGPGLFMICKYFYWSHPENSSKYVEKIENEKIELNDELKIKLREKSGQYAYTLGLITISISIIIFSILGQLAIIDHPRIIIIYLSCYWLFQIIAGIAIFRHQLKKYETP